MPPLDLNSSASSRASRTSAAQRTLGFEVSSVASDASSTGSTTSVIGSSICKPREQTHQERFEMEETAGFQSTEKDALDVLIDPTERTSLLAGTCPATCVCSIAPISASSTVDGWSMLRWWMGGLVLPLGIIAWVFTGGLLDVIAAMLSMPLLAILQGSIQILRYRVKYGDCPLPKAPSHGIVRVANHGNAPTSSDFEHATDTPRENREEQESDNTPLRLLVIGDSLAIGVGQSSSSTPVMPETIAKSLSKDFGGRPVLWTCHGAPGASAGWIVRELERSIKQGTFAQSTAASLGDFNASSASVDFDMEEVNGDSLGVTTTSGLLGATDGESDASSDNSFDDDVDDKRHTWQERLRQKRVHFDPNSVGPFDIAVVVTGSNDLKSAFFPFLLTGEDAKFRREAQQRGGGYGKELTRILQVLNQGMRLRFQTLRDSVEEATQKMRERLVSADSKTEQDRSTFASSRKGDDLPSEISDPVGEAERPHSADLFPMVVLPGMPARALPIFSIAPLRWLAVPVVDIMDSHKRRLATRHRGEVLFVDAPTAEQIKEYVDQEGEYWRQEQQDRILLSLRDIKRCHARQIESDMKEYYLSAKNEKPTTPTPRNRHFDVFSVDGIHPNDVGYKFWGRHIAHHIVQEWNQKKRLAAFEL